MTFFGLTHLGYQNPIGDKMINQWRASQDVSISEGLSSWLKGPQGPLSCADKSKVSPQRLPFSSDTQHRSYKKYREMVKQSQTTTSPKQLYITPLTDNQQYGWMVSDRPEPWTQVRRFPRQLSEMTKFVNEMLRADRDFSLF
uniref:Uncharacterized protein n=1 Tax=Nothobranchius kuhntae TaxID=321403 RepID=A0A1A8IXU5_NOTKU